MRVLFEIFGDRIVHGSSRLPPAQGTGGRPIAFGEWERTRCWVIMNWPRGQVVGVISRVEFAQRRSASHSLSVSLSVCWSPFVLLNIGGRSSSGAVYRSLFQPPTEKTKEVYPARGGGGDAPRVHPCSPTHNVFSRPLGVVTTQASMVTTHWGPVIYGMSERHSFSGAITGDGLLDWTRLTLQIRNWEE